MLTRFAAMTNTRQLALASVLLGAACGGCTRFASEADTLEGEAQGLAIPDASGSDWSCLVGRSGAAVTVTSNPSMLTATTPAPLTYSMLAVDYVSASLPEDLRVRACYRPDVSCVGPATDYLTPSEDGTVKVPLYQNFDGYLEITAEGMIPTLLFFPDPWSRPRLDLLELVPIALLPIAALQALGESARIDVEPTGGIVSMNTYDCQGPAAAGVRLEIDTDSVPFTFVDGLPIAYENVTTGEGAGGFVNVPPGSVVVSAYPGERTQRVGRETVLVRTSWVTVGSMVPRLE